MIEQLKGQMSIVDCFGPDIWSGRTCREHYLRPENETEKITEARTSKPSSRKSSGSSKQMLPMFLYLKTGDGLMQDVSWESERTDSRFPLLTEYTMRSFGEYPKEERESRLSQILEDSPLPKYCLSARACQGILRRAENRGKELPPLLKETLLRQSVSKNEQDVQGGAKESSYNMNEQEHCQHSTTKVFCLQGNGIDRADTAGCNGKGWRENESYTLNTIDRPAVAYSFDSMASNSMKSSNPNSGCHQTDTAKTLDTSDQNPSKNQGGVAILYDAYQHHGYREGESVNPLTRDQNESVRGDTPLIVAQDAYDKYMETDKGASLKACGGSYGGGQKQW